MTKLFFKRKNVSGKEERPPQTGNRMFYEKWQQNQGIWPSLQNPCCCSYMPARQVQASLTTLKPSHPLEFSVIKIGFLFSILPEFLCWCAPPGLWQQDSCYWMCFLEDFAPTEGVAMGVAMPAKEDAVMDTAVLCLPAGRRSICRATAESPTATGCLQDTDWWSVSY